MSSPDGRTDCIQVRAKFQSDWSANTSGVLSVTVASSEEFMRVQPAGKSMLQPRLETKRLSSAMACTCLEFLGMLASIALFSTYGGSPVYIVATVLNVIHFGMIS